MKLFEVHVVNSEGSLITIFTKVVEMTTLPNQTNEIYGPKKSLIGIVPGQFILKIIPYANT